MFADPESNVIGLAKGMWKGAWRPSADFSTVATTESQPS